MRSGEVLTLGRADHPRVAALLARAFQDDPAMTWIFPDAADRARRLPRLFRLMVASDSRAGMGVLTTGGEAVTMWRAPGRAHTTRWEMLREALPLVRALGGNIARALAVSDAIAAHWPAGDFWYLHIAGCDPASQGRGFGGAAIRGGLARVAGSGLPTVLETATERNVGLYASLGFVVTREWDVPRGGPHFWSMRRAAQS